MDRWCPIVLALLLATAEAAATAAAPAPGTYAPAAAPAPPGPALYFKGHAASVHRAAMSPDGGTVATASMDSSVRLWDASTGQTRHILRGHNRDVTSVVFVAGGETVVTAGVDFTVRLWDASTGKPVKTLSGHGMAVLALAASPDGARFASGSTDGTVCLWDAETGDLLRRFRAGPEAATDPADGGPAPAPAPAPAAPAAPAPGPRRPLVIGGSPSLSFSPDADVLAASVGPGAPAAVVWNLRSGKELARLSGDGEGVHTVQFSPDGATLLTASGAQRVSLWETATWKLRRRVTGLRQQGRRLPADFSPDGRRLAAGARGGVTFVDLATGAPAGGLPRAHRGAMYSLAWLPDGRLLTTGDDAAAILWNVPALAPLGSPPTDGAPAADAPATGPRPLPISRQEQLWADLALEDAARSYEAVWALAAAGEQAVAMLAPRLQADAPPDEAQVRRWVRELDDDDYAVREAATRSLADVAEAAEPLLLDAMNAGPPPEVAQRLEMLLRHVPASAVDADKLRTLRSLEVLERVGTPAARAAIERLSGAPGGSRLSRRARGALARLDSRHAPPAAPAAPAAP